MKGDNHCDAGESPVSALTSVSWKANLMGRCGQPAEIASLYVLLASGEDSYTTGQVFGATGGKVGP